MKNSNVKYLLAVSISIFLIIGVVFAKPILSLILPGSAHTPINTVESPNSIFMARDITAYTQNADAIIIGDIHDVTDPYLRKDRGITLQQDAQINIMEVLKGDVKTTSIKVTDLAGQIDEEFSPEKGIENLKGKYGLLKPNEKVLLFLGTNNWGEYVIFAGPYGEYLIDNNNTATSIGDFKMSLEDLKIKIKSALKIPAQKYTPPLPISIDN
jgi:hypothetical protein